MNAATQHPIAHGRLARMFAFAVGIASLGSAWFIPVDSLLSISDLGQRLWMVGGLIGGITIVWIGQHVLHRPMTRGAVIPGGVIGGTTLVLLVASKETVLGELRPIGGLMLATSLLVSCGLRAIWFGLRGPRETGPDWGAEFPEGNARTEADGFGLTSEEALRLARYSPPAPAAAPTDLRLVRNDKLAKRRTADQ